MQGDTLLSGLVDDLPGLVVSNSEEEILLAAEHAPVSDADLIFLDATDAWLAMAGDGMSFWQSGPEQT
ncbi:hypothetical protein [Klebsiella quasipneumoniae]|uniref:hypothetical protein n=1 Tax=Klebsiella quasipneumoniae TaxID=1463165 RepID=UPI001E43F86F|nr:hypothetical protein [Klebsiella quasipneumoniae]